MCNGNCENNMKMSSNCTYRTPNVFTGSPEEGYGSYMYNVPVVIPVYIQTQPVPPVYIQTQPVPTIEMLPSDCSSRYQCL